MDGLVHVDVVDVPLWWRSEGGVHELVACRRPRHMYLEKQRDEWWGSHG